MFLNRKARKETFVLASGVQCTIRAMKGKDQSLISEKDGIYKLVAACIESIGDVEMPEIEGKESTAFKNALQERLDNVKKLLTDDFKYILLKMRVLSFNVRDPYFKFTLDWTPYVKEWQKKGENHKVKTNHSYELIISELITNPYPWVEKNEKGEFVKMYDNYDDMLKNQVVKEFEWTDSYTDESTIIRYQLSTIKSEIEYEKKGTKVTLLSSLQLLNPHYESSIQNEGKEVTKAWLPLPLKELDGIELEELNKKAKSFKTNIDTTVKVEHEESGDFQHLDLIATVDFFAPSYVS